MKDYNVHMYALRFYGREHLPLTRRLSFEFPHDCYMCLRLSLLKSISYFVSLNCCPSSRECCVLESISVNIYNAISIQLSANIFVFGEFYADYPRLVKHPATDPAGN